MDEWLYYMVDATVFQLDDGFFAGNGLDLATQLIAETVAIVAHGLEDKIQRAIFHGFKRTFCTAFCKRTDHQHRHGMGLHEISEGGQAVEARHFHIQGHDIGIQLCRFFQRILPITRRVNHLDVRILLQKRNQGITHES